MSGGIVWVAFFRYLVRYSIQCLLEEPVMAVQAVDVEWESRSAFECHCCDGIVYAASAKLPWLPRGASKWPELR